MPPYRSSSTSTSPVIVLDNGAGLLKAGLAGELNPSSVVPNCSARSPSSKKPLLADQLLSPDTPIASLQLRRPLDRGYPLNPDLLRDIWHRSLKPLLASSHPSSYSLLLTEPLFIPPSLRRSLDEIVFEDFGFRSLYASDSPSLVHLYEAGRTETVEKWNCSLVVDCGFSFTHVAPVVEGFTLNYAVRRMDVGGKALTNYLKEVVSYRSVNLMDETLIMDDAKEKLCFVSLDVQRDLRLARKPGKDNPFRCTYVLPDGITHTRGYVKDNDEAQRYLKLQSDGSIADSETNILTDPLFNTEKSEERKRSNLTENEFNLTNERFLVPEMLFHPADLGINQAGLAECIVRSVNACHPHLHPVLYESIILTGGSTLFPQFAERLEMELRPLVPDNYNVKITRQEDPILGAWRGGSLLASSPDFESMCITKSEYEEMGSARCHRRFFH